MAELSLFKVKTLLGYLNCEAKQLKEVPSFQVQGEYRPHDSRLRSLDSHALGVERALGSSR
jgi:hypothetical protein